MFLTKCLSRLVNNKPNLMSFKIQVIRCKMESNGRREKILKKRKKNLNRVSIILKMFISATLALKFSIMSSLKKKCFHKNLRKFMSK